jgi:hypothetical protein
MADRAEHVKTDWREKRTEGFMASRGGFLEGLSAG